MEKEKEAVDALIDAARRQREIAQNALEQAKEIDALLKTPNVPDAEKSAQLEKAKNQLIRVARELAANSSATTATVTSIITK